MVCGMWIDLLLGSGSNVVVVLVGHTIEFSKRFFFGTMIISTYGKYGIVVLMYGFV